MQLAGTHKADRRANHVDTPCLVAPHQMRPPQHVDPAPGAPARGADGARCSASTQTRKTPLQIPRPTIRSQSRQSEGTVRTHRSAHAFALGARTGASSTSAPSERTTSSKLRGELRLAVAQREPDPSAWLAQAQQQVAGLLGDPRPSGLAVTPARCTRRVSSSMNTSTYSRHSQTVSTRYKSVLARLTVRALYEIFTADTPGHIQSIGSTASSRTRTRRRAGVPARP